MARTGRPKQGAVAKLAPLNMRTSPELRAKIEEAAEETGRSLTQEVERRLRTSFIFDDSRGGPHIGAFANLLSATIQTLELRYGGRWMDDPATWSAVKAATLRLLDWNSPPVPTTPAYDALVSARAERRKAEDILTAHRRSAETPDAVQALIAVAQGGDVAAAIESQRKIAELQSAFETSMRAEIAAGEAFEEESAALFARVDEASRVGIEIASALFEDLGPKGRSHGA